MRFPAGSHLPKEGADGGRIPLPLMKGSQNLRHSEYGIGLALP